MNRHDCNPCYILYLGDHDPSGLDMIRDIRDRFFEFGLRDIEVDAIALTSGQIVKYNPPPNPAKFQDPRAKEYINKFGKVSWEVDALNPKILNTLIRDKINELIDIDLFNGQLEKEEKDKNNLTKLIKDTEE